MKRRHALAAYEPTTARYEFGFLTHQNVFTNIILKFKQFEVIKCACILTVRYTVHVS